MRLWIQFNALTMRTRFVSDTALQTWRLFYVFACIQNTLASCTRGNVVYTKQAEHNHPSSQSTPAGLFAPVSEPHRVKSIPLGTFPNATELCNGSTGASIAVQYNPIWRLPRRAEWVPTDQISSISCYSKISDRTYTERPQSQSKYSISKSETNSEKQVIASNYSGDWSVDLQRYTGRSRSFDGTNFLEHERCYYNSFYCYSLLTSDWRGRPLVKTAVNWPIASESLIIGYNCIGRGKVSVLEVWTSSA